MSTQEILTTLKNLYPTLDVLTGRRDIAVNGINTLPAGQRELCRQWLFGLGFTGFGDQTHANSLSLMIS